MAFIASSTKKIVIHDTSTTHKNQNKNQNKNRNKNSKKKTGSNLDKSFQQVLRLHVISGISHSVGKHTLPICVGNESHRIAEQEHKTIGHQEKSRSDLGDYGGDVNEPTKINSPPC